MVSPELLRRYPYFADAKDSTLKELAMIAEEETVLAGKVLFKQGEPATHLYVIVEGEVDIKYELANGEQRTVDTLVAGDLLVWSAIVIPYKTTAIGTARKKLKLIAINAEGVRKLMYEDAPMGLAMMTQVAKALAHRLENARIQLATV